MASKPFPGTAGPAIPPRSRRLVFASGNLELLETKAQLAES